ncbi:hypothetical protein [Streptomyces cucumeris]|uniref:hypothetical protein n=1 Tax=Streptomyces cucumeris TaxID=2962890 RepID=UPI003EBED961
MTALVEDLNNRERAVALYASAMPTDYVYRVADGEKLTAWIVQGASRVGWDALYALAAAERNYWVRWLDNKTAPGEKTAHRRRFPKARRLHRAGEIAATVTLNHVNVSESAKERQEMPLSAFASAPVRLVVAA